ncbi:MAG: macro domain-containing protein [Thermomicrobiales bacterium]
MSEPYELGDGEDAVRFGRALLIASARPILDHQVMAIATPANRRGAMGVGVAGAVRMAGGIEIEREAMAKAPLGLGTALATGPGMLGSRGVVEVIHAVVSDSLGSPTRAETIRQATAAVLQVADEARLKSIAMPPLGSGMAAQGLTEAMGFALMIEEMVAYLRRFSSRLERIVLVCGDAREVREVGKLLREARVLWGELLV